MVHRAYVPYSISIGLAVFAGLTVVKDKTSDILTDLQTDHTNLSVAIDLGRI